MFIQDEGRKNFDNYAVKLSARKKNMDWFVCQNMLLYSKNFDFKIRLWIRLVTGTFEETGPSKGINNINIGLSTMLFVKLKASQFDWFICKLQWHLVFKFPLRDDPPVATCIKGVLVYLLWFLNLYFKFPHHQSILIPSSPSHPYLTIFGCLFYYQS